MIEYKEITFQGKLKFKIPARDTEEEWLMQIAIWLNSSWADAVQKAIYECAEKESEYVREENLKKLLDD
jgi:hypothetical protein